MYVDNINPVIEVLRHILRQIRDFDRPQKEVASIQTVLRKLMMIRELHSTWFVSIAGTQGAGKTSLLSELYGLQDWLTPNIGRGERRPLFVIEKQCDAPYATGITADGLEERIDAQTLKSELDSFSDGMRYQLLRLYVPCKHFSEGFGFLLLPGHERRNDANKQWQEEMRATLRHSMGSILVTDQTRTADVATSEILKDLMETCFAGRAPLVAITRTEGKTEQVREELRQSAAQACKVDPAEIDRVVCTGTGEAWREEWLPVFLDALKKYTKATNEVNRERLNDLAEVVNENLEEVVQMLQDMVGQVNMKTSGQELLLSSIMDKFRAASAKYRNDLERKLRERSENYACLATEKARKLYIEEEEGFGNKVKTLWEKIKLNSGQIEQRHLDRIISNWAEQDGRTPLEIPYLAMTDMAEKKLSLKYQGGADARDKEIIDVSRESNAFPLLLGYEAKVVESEESSGDLQIFKKEVDRNKLVRTMTLLLKEHGNADVHELQLLKEAPRDISETLELLPTLAMEYVRVVQAGALAVGPSALKETSGNSIKVEEVSKEITDGLATMSDTTKGILKTVLAIAAVDIGVDGSFDIPKILAGAPLVGMGAHLSLIAGGIIGAAYTGYKISQSIAQYDTEKKNFIALGMESLASKQVNKALESYDEISEKMQDCLSRNLSKAYGVDKDLFSERDALARSLYSLKTACRDLNKNVDYAQCHYLV